MAGNTTKGKLLRSLLLLTMESWGPGGEAAMGPRLVQLRDTDLSDTTVTIDGKNYYGFKGVDSAIKSSLFNDIMGLSTPASDDLYQSAIESIMTNAEYVFSKNDSNLNWMGYIQYFGQLKQTIQILDPTIQDPAQVATFYPGWAGKTDWTNGTSGSSSGAGSGDTPGTGAGGDPYICTLNNQLYKMANFEGYSRMIQGEYLGKLFTINVATRMSTEKEAEESRQFVLKELEKINDKYPGSTTQFEVMDYLNKNEAFMSELFIQFGNECMTIDMNKLEILDNSSNFIINDLGCNSGKSFKDMSMMEHYKVQQDRSIEVKINDLSVIVSQIDNPQVKTGFNLQNGYLIKNAAGALVNTLYSKDIKIKKLNSLAEIQRTEDRTERRITREMYLNNNNEQVYKNIKMY